MRTLWFSDGLLLSAKNTSLVEFVEGMPDPTRDDDDQYEQV